MDNSKLNIEIDSGLLERLENTYESQPGNRIAEFESVSDDFISYLNNIPEKDTDKEQCVKTYNLEIDNIKLSIIKDESILKNAIEKLNSIVVKPIVVDKSQENFFNKIIDFKSRTKDYNNALGSFVTIDNKNKTIKIDEDSNLWTLLCENAEAKAAYNRNTKGKADENTENSRTPDSELLINCFNIFIKNSISNSSSDKFDKDINKLVALRAAAENEKNGTSKKMAFDNKFNSLLKEYENQEDKLSIIKGYALDINSNNSSLKTGSGEKIPPDHIEVADGLNVKLNKENLENGVILGALEREAAELNITDRKAITKFQLKVAQVKDYINREYGIGSPLSILETADVNGLQLTTMRPIEVLDKKSVERLNKGNIDEKDIKNWGEDFTATFWNRVTGMPTFPRFVNKKNKSQKNEKHYKFSGIKQIYLSKDEAIANDIRVGVEGTALDVEKLWQFDDNFLSCKELQILYMSFNIATKAIYDNKPIKITEEDKFTQFCKGLFDKFKKLNDIYIGDKHIKRGDPDNFDYFKALEGRRKVDLINSVTSAALKKSDNYFGILRNSTADDWHKAVNLDRAEKSTARDLTSGKSKGKGGTTSGGDGSFTKGISNLAKNVGNGVKNTATITGSVLKIAGNIISIPLRVAGFIAKPIIRLFF